MNEKEKLSGNLPATGELGRSSEETEGARIIAHPFAQYEILIKVAEDGKFIEVVGISINKDFRSYLQRIVSTGHHNVEQFYEE